MTGVEDELDSGAAADLDAKEARLRRAVRELEGGVVVAFSGGVDSALLLLVCADELKGRVLAVTAESPSFPQQDRRDAALVAKQLEVAHVSVSTHEMNDPQYVQNDASRCYFCKHSLFETLEPIARSSGLRHLAFGANLDDEGDYRPGHRAAAEFAVKAPLLDAGLRKADVRALAKKLGLSIWNKPGSACLASRIPYGTAIDPAVLARVDAAENALRELGFPQLRVRHHGDVARLELDPSDIARAAESREAIHAVLRAQGWRYATLDLLGYRTGSLNEALPRRET